MQIAFVTTLALMGWLRVGATTKLFSDEHIAHINSQATTWVAGRNFPEDTTIDNIKSLLGVKKLGKNPLDHKQAVDIDEGSLPESFDAREEWANCTSVSLIRDQSKCGSCWAVATTSVISDRICIHSNGQIQLEISSADLMSCCKNCGEGCDGGSPPMAFNYWKNNGLVTGGEFGTRKGCKPYPFPKCTHYGDSTKYPKCPSERYSTPSCKKACSHGGIRYTQDLRKAASVYAVRGVAQIQNEILTNGPVEADFSVYDDFPNYKSGVYQKTKGAKFAGGHAVRLIGWGVENNVPYWLVANSWNEAWGDNGTFKIRRGNNECGFEEDIIAGIPQN